MIREKLFWCKHPKIHENALPVKPICCDEIYILYTWSTKFLSYSLEKQHQLTVTSTCNCQLTGICIQHFWWNIFDTLPDATVFGNNHCSSKNLMLIWSVYAEKFPQRDVTQEVELILNFEFWWNFSVCYSTRVHDDCFIMQLHIIKDDKHARLSTSVRSN